jgi:hypothetical protein
MAKKVKARKKRRKWRNTIVILSFVTIMTILITLSALYQSKPQPIQKEPADEYFTFSPAEAYADATDETNKSIYISELHFNFTAVGGNAKNVLVSPVQGYVSTQDYPYFEEILQNQTEQVYLTYPSRVFSSRKGQGYPVYFNISCDKAEGRVTVYITEFFPLT